ncbi:MAG: plasmid replication protein RepC [Deltaproteobacteria bacterium]
MNHISTTPFGRRPVTAGLMAAKALAEQPAPDTKTDKWAIFRDLTEARMAFGVTDRDLTVLAALLSFHREDALSGDNLVVFPSNASLSSRAHGMAESTLRRHLAALVAAGLILRHDSPNGKRYAARGLDGAVEVAFGFSLKPLMLRLSDITTAARTARAAALQLKRLREEVVLVLRDASKLFAYAEESQSIHPTLKGDLATLQRALRRRLDGETLADLLPQAVDVKARIEGLLKPETNKMDGNAVDNERHIHDSNPSLNESEPCKEKQGEKTQDRDTGQGARLPIFLVVKACPELRTYIADDIRHWSDLVAAARFLRPMLGISAEAWAEAEQAMGPSDAAIVLAAILQAGTKINSPGGYLRALSRKAQTGSFSPGPMIMALLNGANTHAI